MRLLPPRTPRAPHGVWIVLRPDHFPHEVPTPPPPRAQAHAQRLIGNPLLCALPLDEHTDILAGDLFQTQFADQPNPTARAVAALYRQPYAAEVAGPVLLVGHDHDGNRLCALTGPALLHARAAAALAAHLDLPAPPLPLHPHHRDKQP